MSLHIAFIASFTINFLIYRSTMTYHTIQGSDDNVLLRD